MQEEGVKENVVCGGLACIIELPFNVCLISHFYITKNIIPLQPFITSWLEYCNSLWFSILYIYHISTDLIPLQTKQRKHIWRNNLIFILNQIPQKRLCLHSESLYKPTPITLISLQSLSSSPILQSRSPSHLVLYPTSPRVPSFVSLCSLDLESESVEIHGFSEVVCEPNPSSRWIVTNYT